MDPKFLEAVQEAGRTLNPSYVAPEDQPGMVEKVVGAQVDLAREGGAAAASSAWDTVQGWADGIVEGSGVKRLASEDFWGGEVDHSQDLLHELETGGPSSMPNSTEEAQVGEVNAALGDSTLARTTAATIAGVADAGLQTFDAVKDDYTYTGPKSAFRQYIEAVQEDNRKESAVAAITGDIVQFTAGMVGAGKLLGPLKALGGGKGAMLAWETTRGAMAGYFAMDPNDDRLADLVQAYPGLRNPVSEFLSHQPGDTDSMGRFKSALEGIGMDLAVAGVFAASMKAIRAFRKGDTEVAEEALKEATEAEAKLPEKVRVRVKAGSERVPMAGQEASQGVTGTQPSVTVVDEIGSELPQEATPVKKKRIKEISKPDYKTILDSSRQDERAIEMAGSYEAAKLAGWEMSKTQTHPWQLLNAPDEVKVYMENVANTLKPMFDKVKGGDILTDPTLRRQAMSMVDWYGEDPAGFFGAISQSAKEATNIPRNMIASYMVANSGYLDVYKMAKDLEFGKYSLYGATPEAADMELLRRLEIVANIDAAGKAMSSNLGRGLRAHQGRFGFTAEDLARVKSMDSQTRLSLIASTGGDPKKLRDLKRPGFIKRFMDEAMFIQRNGLLWGYPSHIVNVTGNVLMLVARPTEKLIGGSLRYVAGQGSGPMEQAAKEMYYTATSLWDGLKDGATAFMRGDSKLAPHTSGWVDTEGALDTTALRPLNQLGLRPMKDFSDIYHNMAVSLNYLYRNVGGMPTRMMAGQDEFFKTVRYRAVVQGRAANEAASQGLTGKDLRDYVAAKLKQAFDDTGQGIDRAALLEAQTATFNQELLKGTLGATVRNARANHQWLGAVLPFVKTPVNVLRYAHKYTPVLNIAQKEYRQMLLGSLGPEQQAQAMGQMALGSLFGGAAVMLAASGKVTGGGPSDMKLAAELRAQGWRPYSWKKVNEDGSTTYVPYNRFEPVGLVMGIAADMNDRFTMDPESRDYDDIATMLALSLAKNFGDRTFLQNLSNMFDAASDPDANLERFLGTTVAGFVPGSSAMRNYLNEDPYMRETRTVLDMALKDVPGYSEGMPPKRDVWGEPISRRIGLTTTSKLDVVEEEHQRIMVSYGMGINKPSPSIGQNLDLRDITLKNGRNAYDLYQELASQPDPKGMTLKGALEKLITSKTYANLIDGPADVKGTKLNAMSGIVQSYRSAAMKRLQAENPDLLGAIKERELKAAAGWLQNTGQSTSPVDKIKDALGIAKE